MNSSAAGFILIAAALVGGISQIYLLWRDWSADASIWLKGLRLLNLLIVCAFSGLILFAGALGSYFRFQ